MLLAMIIAAISITACSSNSEDDENSEGAVKGQKTLIVNDESFYATNCTAEQTKRNGMYLNIRASTEPEYCLVGHELVVHAYVGRNSVSSIGQNQSLTSLLN